MLEYLKMLLRNPITRSAIIAKIGSTVSLYAEAIIEVICEELAEWEANRVGGVYKLGVKGKCYKYDFEKEQEVVKIE